MPLARPPHGPLPEVCDARSAVTEGGRTRGATRKPHRAVGSWASAWIWEQVPRDPRVETRIRDGAGIGGVCGFVAAHEFCALSSSSVLDRRGEVSTA